MDNNMMDEYKKLFLEEADEYIIALNDSLVALEKDKNNKDLIDNIFRVAHTLKSSAAAVGYDDLSKLSHKAEDLMQGIRSGETDVTGIIVDALFEVFDIVKEYIQCIKDNKEIDIDINKMIKKLEKIKNSSNGKEETDTCDTGNTGENKQFEEIVLTEYEKKVIEQETGKGKNGYMLNIEVDPRESLKWLRADLLINNIKKISEIVKIHPEKKKFISHDFTGFFSVVITTAEDKDKIPGMIMIDLIKSIEVEPILFTDKKDKQKKESQKKKASKKTGNGRKSKKVKAKKLKKTEEIKEISNDDPDNKITDQTNKNQITASGDIIRVPVKKLDNLMHLIGELVIANSGLKIVENIISKKYKDTAISSEMSSVTDKMINISSELQNSIMKTRMLPISHIFNQFNRIVRDLGKEEGKDINLIIKGAETELDKKMIDSIGDPLMHLVRNSVDHGIEHPAERKKKGKPPNGTIILAASQSGNHIIISIKDDGKGIDIEKVKNKAIKNGLFNKKTINEISNEQIMKLIYEAGFSTSEKVSAVSGRGVGLDVVKTVIGKLSGTVDIKTKPGKGTEFIITLPLTLAITSVIMIQVEGDLYAIPITDIEETLRITREGIQTIQGIKAIKLRDEVLPIVNLDYIFGNSDNIEEIEFKDNQKQPVVVVSHRKRKTGLIADKIIGKQEIVLKPLEEHYQSLEGLSGAAILGDGKIVLVIDVIGILNIIKDMSEKLAEITRLEEKKAALILNEKEKDDKEIKDDEIKTEEKSGQEHKAVKDEQNDKKEKTPEQAEDEREKKEEETREKSEIKKNNPKETGKVEEKKKKEIIK